MTQEEKGPAMSARLGMSEDWIITAWDYENDRWAHFICIKLRSKYDVLELDLSSGKLAKVENPEARTAPTKKTPTLRVASVDIAAEKIEMLLEDPDAEDEDEEMEEEGEE